MEAPFYHKFTGDLRGQADSGLMRLVNQLTPVSPLIRSWCLFLVIKILQTSSSDLLVCSQLASLSDRFAFPYEQSNANHILPVISGPDLTCPPTHSTPVPHNWSQRLCLYTRLEMVASQFTLELDAWD